MPQGAVALVIPAWNEPDAIGAVLEEIPPETADHVIVVVGSAEDPTGEVAARHGATVVVQHTRGYGAACWTGAQRALDRGASIVAFLDGDHSDPPSALPRLLAAIQAGEADLVLGCRDLRRYPHALPAHARLGNGMVCAALNLALRTRFRDLPSYKAIRAESLRTLDMHEMTYGWTVEMLAKAVRRGLRIQQVPVEYRPRLGGQSKVSGNPRASLAAAYKLLSCALSYSL